MKPITNIRKAVTTLANRLNRKIQNLSSAFIRAWQIVKGRVLLSKVTGVSFGSRPAALAKLARINPKNITVELIREADNQYDANAVAVYVAANGSSMYHLGYIPHDTAELVSKLMDNGIKLQTAFKAVTGGTAERFNYGAVVEITL